ncbi:hypothetical protein [Alishewanella sp. WH16-1]|nr:hypothetical protein [Alishewanella sp. WH16-1]
MDEINGQSLNFYADDYTLIAVCIMRSLAAKAARLSERCYTAADYAGE